MKYLFNTKFKLSMLAAIAMFFLGACTKQDRADYDHSKISGGKYIVAQKYAGTEMADNLSLTFDIDSLINLFDIYLKDNFGGQYMVENISAFFLEDSLGEKTPILQVSIVDLIEEYSENNFFILDSVKTLDGSFCYALSPYSTSITCRAIGECRAKWNGEVSQYACQPRKGHKSGNWYCTSCTTYGSLHNGSCEQTVSIVANAGILYELLSSLYE